MWLLPLSILVTAGALSIPLSRYLAWIMDGHYHAPRLLRWFEERLDTGPSPLMGTWSGCVPSVARSCCSRCGRPDVAPAVKRCPFCKQFRWHCGKWPQQNDSHGEKEHMRKNRKRIAGRWGVRMLVWSMMLGTVPAGAQETPPPATEEAEAPAKPSPWSPVEAVRLAGPLKDYGWEIHGLLATNYTYNFNEPASGKNGLLLMNRKADHFDLDLANIRIQRVIDGGIGFVTDLNFGKTAEVVGRSTRWCEDPRCGESRNSFELSQFYLTYKFPLGNGLTVKAGKWVTLHGAEVIKTWDNINYNISNTILFGYAIPFTHTGLLFNYLLTGWLSLDAGFIVGWDNLYDSNDGKSFTGGLTITPTSTLTFYAAGTVGPEQDNRGDSTRGLFTLLTTYKPTDKWTFILDYNHADETNLLPPFRIPPSPAKPSGRGTRDARWDGLAGYVIYHFTDKLSGTLRAEFFDDVDGVRAGTKQTMWEITPTLAYQLLPGLTLRVEFRHDESSNRFFEGRALAHPVPDGPATRLFPGQDTVAWELVYAF